MRAHSSKCLATLCTCISLALVATAARGQTFRYEAEPRAGEFSPSFADDDPVPGMRASSVRPPRRLAEYRGRPGPRSSRFGRRRPAPPRRDEPRRPVRYDEAVLITAEGEVIPPGQPVEPFVEDGPIAGDAPPPPPGWPVEEYYEGEFHEPHLTGEPFLHGPPCGGCGHCQDCCPGGACYLRRWGHGFRRRKRQGAFTENLQLFSGKQGFKGPVDQGINGDFGFHFGLNWGLPLVDRWGLGYQVGGNLVLSDFDGRSGIVGHRRVQWFFTTGVFRRAPGDSGFQGGAVVDYLHDIFYIRMNLWQFRTELSYFYHGHEIGYWGAARANSIEEPGRLNENSPEEIFRFEGTNQYTAFYRYTFCSGTYCRTFAGFTGNGDGIFGGDATVFISPRFGMIAATNYLVPRDQGVPNDITESWNLTISFVWYPGYNRRRRNSWLNPYRPLFYTADNGWFFVRQKN